MPILSTKNNPPFKSFESSILEKEGIWWLAKVKSRMEKAFAFDLLGQGIDYCLPCYEKKALRSDGKFRKSLLVLFPLYVPFISENPYELLSSRRVLEILKIRQQQKFKTELQYLWQAKESQIPMEPIVKAEPLLSDKPVEIVTGPLKGAAGLIMNIQNGKGDLMVSTDSLGCTKMTVGVESINSKQLAACTVSLDSKVLNESLIIKSTACQNINQHRIFTKAAFDKN